MTIVGHSPPLRVRVDWSGVERGGEGKGGGGQTVDRKGGEPGQEQRRYRTRYKTHATRLSGLQLAVELDQGYGDDFSLSRRASQS